MAVGLQDGTLDLYQKNGAMLSKILRFAGVPVRQVDFFGADFIVAASEEPGIRIVSTSSADKVHPSKTFDCTLVENEFLHLYEMKSIVELLFANHHFNITPILVLNTVHVLRQGII